MSALYLIDYPNLHASGSPLNSSWLLRLRPEHPDLLAGSPCSAHVLSPLCPCGRAFGGNLGEELGWISLLDITAVTDGLVHRCTRSQGYPQACKHIWRPNVRLLLGMPAALPCSQAQWYSCLLQSPGSWQLKLLFTESTRDQKQIDLYFLSFFFFFSPVKCNELLQVQN